MWSWGMEATTTAGPSDTLIGAIFGLAGTIVVTLGAMYAASRRNRPDQTSPSPLGSAEGYDIGGLRERVAVLERRAEDNDQRDETQDRRLDQHERALDIDNPEWRHG